MIRAIHDVKGIDIGSNLIRYKVSIDFIEIICSKRKIFNTLLLQAEVDFDGRALTRSYLEKHDLNALIEVRVLSY